MKRDLTFRERLFVEAYIGRANGNATEAARIAGYAHPAVTGHKLTGKPKIRAGIASRLDVAALTANEILARLAVIATGDMGDFVSIAVIPAVEADEEKGIAACPAREYLELDLVKALKGRKLGLVKRINQTAHGLSVELYDAQAALVQLGKYHGLWQERLVIEPTEAKPVPSEEAAAALAAAKAVRDARGAESIDELTRPSHN